MGIISVYGIDPGLVHTGVVRMTFDVPGKHVSIGATVIDGADPTKVSDAIGIEADRHVFIEGYKPRAHFGTDAEMVKAVALIHKALPGSKVLLNTGVKRVVKPPLMRLLEVWRFGVRTHHEDLRSAARIALLGMLKENELNKLLTQVVSDHLDGWGWDVLV